MNLDDSNLPFLHGTLILGIHEAKDLPDSDSAKNVTDAYASAELWPVGLKVAETKVVNDSLFPEWNEEFRLTSCYNATSLRVSVKDADMFGKTDTIGTCEVSIEDVLQSPGELIKDWHDLQVGDDGEAVQGQVLISLQYIPLDHDQTDDLHGLDADESYYQSQDNNHVTLYQCADTPQLPIFEGVTNPDGSEYLPSRLWRDVYKTISSAQKFIYIAGWSVFTEISLLRGDEDPDGTQTNLGALLKAKADQGVKVLVMIWNEKASIYGREGLLWTHDELTEEYFVNTSVTVANVSRVRMGGGVGMVEREMTETVFTHHQKTVIADAGIEGSDKRRIVGFVGGVDLTDGRYDTPEFPLFNYAKTHGQDFYQNCTMGATMETGPREPWQDIHAKVEGPAVRDLLENFEQRWRLQAEDKAGFLLDISEDEFELIHEPSMENPWSVQVLRSITCDSCIFDTNRSHTLMGKRGYLVDNSIFRAYVKAIRNAKHFIYMENQYFLGSAYSWNHDRDAMAHHTVPRELVTKIINMIEADKMFTVYITIPMFPEGDPTSSPSQEILYWQRRTMEAMYFRIGNAIQRKGSEAKPTDYLKFFCLGKRETESNVPEGMPLPDDEDSPAFAARQSLRHPVYVHSKMMIVDDDYIIVGSANINQRSMAGSRDSEIAIGAFQPSYMSDADNVAYGDIHTFRLALWSAHLGGYDPVIDHPGSKECALRVQVISDNFRETYSQTNMEEECSVHLMSYPIMVHDSGTVDDLPGWETFPDQGGNVAGAKSNFLPGKVTT